MKVLCDESGFVMSFAFIGDLVDGLEVPDPDDLELFMHRFYAFRNENGKQDKDISAIKQEQAILTEGILACLQGLREQGCNGPVTAAITKIEAYINAKAHEQDNHK